MHRSRKPWASLAANAALTKSHSSLSVSRVLFGSFIIGNMFMKSVSLTGCLKVRPFFVAIFFVSGAQGELTEWAHWREGISVISGVKWDDTSGKERRYREVDLGWVQGRRRLCKAYNGYVLLTLLSTISILYHVDWTSPSSLDLGSALGSAVWLVYANAV